MSLVSPSFEDSDSLIGSVSSATTSCLSGTDDMVESLSVCFSLRIWLLGILSLFQTRFKGSSWNKSNYGSQEVAPPLA